MLYVLPGAWVEAQVKNISNSDHRTQGRNDITILFQMVFRSKWYPQQYTEAANRYTPKCIRTQTKSRTFG